MTPCIGFGCDRVSFLHSSPYGAMFWICYQNGADNTPMVLLLVNCACTVSRSSLVFHSVGGVGKKQGSKVAIAQGLAEHPLVVNDCSCITSVCGEFLWWGVFLCVCFFLNCFYLNSQVGCVLFVGWLVCLFSFPPCFLPFQFPPHSCWGWVTNPASPPHAQRLCAFLLWFKPSW